MPLFPFKSNNHFVASSNGSTLQIYELTKPTNHLSSIHEADWKQIATIINTGLEEDNDDTEEELSYDGLLFFDGHGMIEGREELTMLAQHLEQLHLLVSPEGYCFQQVSDLSGVYSNFGIHYLRLNDLFSWPRHGVDLATTNAWGRLELKYRPPRRRINSTSEPVRQAELEMQVKKKDEELERLKGEMEASAKELRKLKKANEEQEEKQIREKDNVLEQRRKLKKEREASEKELQKLEKANEEQEKQIREKDIELERCRKLKEASEKELRKLEKANEEQQKHIQNKDNELERCRKLKESSEKELQKLEKANEEQETQIRIKDNELEYIQKRSWVILPSTKLLPRTSDAKAKHLAIRRPVPPQIFWCHSGLSGFPSVNNSPKLIDKMRVWGNNKVSLVDEDEESMTTWTPPPILMMYVGAGDKDFDPNDWWYAKATHPGGGLTMLAYYDGKRSEITHSNTGEPVVSPVIPLPFSKGVTEFTTYDNNWLLFDLSPLGYRLGFTYRPS